MWPEGVREKLNKSESWCFRDEKGGGVCGYSLLCDCFSLCLYSKKRNCGFELHQGPLMCLGAKVKSYW